MDQQVTECRKFAESRGWDIADVMSDNDISAYTGKRRPAYEKLLERISGGEVDAVLIWAQDRLTRRPLELERYISVCEPRGVPTYSVTGGTLDLTTSVGRMQARIAGAVNRNEVDQLRTRVERGLKARAARGEPVGGRRPFGFADDRVTHRTSEADAIREACESLLAGDTLHGIAKRWRDSGFKTTGGHEWRPQRLREVLRRARNAGLIEHRGDILGAATWSPIVSYEMWTRVRALLADPARRTKPGTQPKFLGSFVYRCGVCGSFMRTGRGGGERKARAYLCSALDRSGERHPAIPQEACDVYVVDFIVNGLHESGFVLDNETPAGSDRDTRGERIAELEARRRTLVRNHIAGLISDDDLDDALQGFAAQMSGLEASVPPQVSRTDVADLASDQRAWSDLSVDRQRAIVREFAQVEILLATSTRQPVHYWGTDVNGNPVRRSDRIRVTLDLSVE